MSSVTAVVIGGAAAAAPPGDLAEVREIGDQAQLAAAAREASTPSLWLLDAGAVANVDTLAELLEHAGPAAVSLPVDPSGAPVESLMGRFADEAVPALLDAVGQRCVPLRHTTVTSMLVEARIVAALAPPDPHRFGRYAGTEWTARLFSGARGVLVPSSRVQAQPVAPGRSSMLHALRLARTGAWRRGEALREIHAAASGWTRGRRGAPRDG